MIEAQVHSKLPEVDNSEDLLTSTVFGLLKYLTDIRPLLAILKPAISASEGENAKPIFDCIPYDLSEYEPGFIFWPYVSEYGEPDMLIKFHKENKPPLILCIEVKYYSSKSGEGENDQLRRYFEGLSIAAQKGDASFLGVVYLTMHPSSPEIKDSLGHIKNKGFSNAEDKLFQLRWHQITKALREFDKKQLPKTDEDIVNDLVRYLEAKHLVEFAGFTFFDDKCKVAPGIYYPVVKPEFAGFTFTDKSIEAPKGTLFYGG